jgi:hypothetical protein
MSLLRFAFFAFVVLIAGCQSHLNCSKTIELQHGENYRFTVDPPKKDQAVVVTFNSSDSAVNVCICLKSDEQAVADWIERNKQHAGVLAKIEGVKEGSLEAKIPAGTESVVFVWNANKKTTVKVQLTGK